MGKKYFMKWSTARTFAKKKGSRIMSTSSVWQKKDKRRARKNYVVKW